MAARETCEKQNVTVVKTDQMKQIKIERKTKPI